MGRLKCELCQSTELLYVERLSARTTHEIVANDRGGTKLGAFVSSELLDRDDRVIESLREPHRELHNIKTDEWVRCAECGHEFDLVDIEEADYPDGVL
jgi:hypothetical protein